MGAAMCPSSGPGFGANLTDQLGLGIGKKTKRKWIERDMPTILLAVPRDALEQLAPFSGGLDTHS